MGRNCLEGYLTDHCGKCEYWLDGSIPDRGIGCGCPFPIMECSYFAKMCEEDERKEKELKIQNIMRYLSLVCKQAAKVENRNNDVKWQFCIISDVYFIVAFKTKYLRVYRRILYRLANNFEKNFGLIFKPIVNRTFDIEALPNARKCFGFGSLSFSFNLEGSPGGPILPGPISPPLFIRILRALRRCTSGGYRR